MKTKMLLTLFILVSLSVGSARAQGDIAERQARRDQATESPAFMIVPFINAEDEPARDLHVFFDRPAHVHASSTDPAAAGFRVAGQYYRPPSPAYEVILDGGEVAPGGLLTIAFAQTDPSSRTPTLTHWYWSTKDARGRSIPLSARHVGRTPLSASLLALAEEIRTSRRTLMDKEASTREVRNKLADAANAAKQTSRDYKNAFGVNDFYVAALTRLITLLDEAHAAEQDAAIKQQIGAWRDRAQAIKDAAEKMRG